MLSSIRSRVSPGTVIGTIALFAALGGGYATAFSGSGTVQKGKMTGLPVGEEVTVRTLTGIGSLVASCDAPEAPILFHVHNSSGGSLDVTSYDEKIEDYQIEELPNGNDSMDRDIPAGQTTTVRYHISSAADDDKRPQADMVVTAFGGEGVPFNCDDAEVAALVLNTEE